MYHFIVTALLMTAEPAPPLLLNQIQVIGTHNSYHQRPSGEFLKIARVIVKDAEDWDYSHPPLPAQLDAGVRSFELDLHHLPNGWNVFHVPHYDPNTSCQMFRDCLQSVKDWSDAHPGHIPVFFLLEIKEEESKFSPIPPAPIDRAALEKLDVEIRGVFPPERLVAPDDVRGGAETLEAAVLTHAWPPLEWCRNRVMFVLHEGGEFRELYVEGRTSLEGCAMFVRSQPGRPDAATLVMDSPDPEEIQPMVKKGYWVRTRADSGLRYGEAPYPRRARALETGAHVISTDFPPGSPSKDGYTVSFENNLPVRCNPVNAPEVCEVAEAKP